MLEWPVRFNRSASVQFTRNARSVLGTLGQIRRSRFLNFLICGPFPSLLRKEETKRQQLSTSQAIQHHQHQSCGRSACRQPHRAGRASRAGCQAQQVCGRQRGPRALRSNLGAGRHLCQAGPLVTHFGTVLQARLHHTCACMRHTLHTAPNPSCSTSQQRRIPKGEFMR
jgi:hypothetical protein